MAPETPSHLAGYEKAVLAELPVLDRVARRLCLDAELAEDLVGQTLLQAARAWAGFDGRHLRAWLLTILRNEHKGELRRRGSRPATEHFDDRFEPPTTETIERIERGLTNDEVVRALDGLPEAFRLAVTLCDVEELSYEEAADLLEVPIGTVRSRLFRGRNLLRQRLSHLQDD